MGKRINDITELKIMIADDQNEARAMMKNMLNSIGINQIFESKDGREALAFIDAAPDMIDVIMCDWNMPKMSGVEVLRQLRTVDADMPFLMITGRSDMDSVVEAKGSGVTGYIRKPFSQTQLEAKLHVIMHKMSA